MSRQELPGVFVLCLGYVLSQFYRSFLAVLTPILSNDLGMSASELALASGGWFVTFALFQFPVGILLDSIGPRRTAGYIFLLGAGGGALLFAFATTGSMVILAMGLIGIGCSPVLMAPLFIFARRLKPALFATSSATFIAVGTLGNIAGTEPLAAGIATFGWRTVGLFLVAVTVAVGLAIFFLTVDPPAAEARARKGGYRELFSIRKLWPIFPIIFAGYAVAAGVRSLWVGPYLEDIYAMNSLEIGRVTLFLAIALAAGSLFYGPLDRLFNSRKRVIMAGNLIVLGACLWMAVAAPAGVVPTAVLFVLMCFFGASYAVQMAHGKAFIPPHLTGRGVTLLNFCSIGGAGVLQVLSGWVVESNTVAGNPQSAYVALFWFYTAIMFITLAVYLFSEDARPAESAS